MHVQVLHTHVTYLYAEPFLSFSLSLYSNCTNHGNHIPHMQVVLTHRSCIVFISLWSLKRIPSWIVKVESFPLLLSYDDCSMLSFICILGLASHDKRMKGRTMRGKRMNTKRDFHDPPTSRWHAYTFSAYGRWGWEAFKSGTAKNRAWL